MSCNCKVNEKIKKIYKSYGHRTNINVSEKIIFKLKELLKFLILMPILLIIFPITFIWIFSLILKGENNINISNILKRIKKIHK